MKKLFLFFMFLFLIFLSSPIKTNATTSKINLKEYVEINIGNDSMLEEEGLTLLSGTVNWNKCGIYEITYSDESGNIYKKDVIVIDKQTDHFINQNVLSKISLSDEYQIVDIKNINETSFYLICNYQDLNSTYYDSERVCVIYYENNTYMWEYHYNKYSRYVKSLLYNDNLILTGKVYNETNNYNSSILLLEINKNREIKKLREIKSNNQVLVYNINLYQNELFLITSTTGTTDDFETINNDGYNHLIILNLDLFDFSCKNSYLIEDLTNFNVLDTCFFKDKISINVYLSEDKLEGYEDYSNLVYVIDSSFNTQKIYPYNIGTNTYLSYGITEHDVFYIGSNFYDGIDNIYIKYINSYTINRQVYLNNKEKLPINEALLININEDEIYLSISYHESNKYTHLGYCKVTSSNDPIYYFKNDIGKNIYYTYINNERMYEGYYKNDNFYIGSVDLIEIYLDSFTFDNYSSKEKIVYYNTKKLKNQSEDVKETTYGSYNYINFFIDENHTKYYLSKNVDIKLKTNVIKNETYQIGKKIIMNGQGVLNGKEIKSGYVVNDIGKYLLVINGANDQKVALNFEIKDLNEHEITKEEINFNIKDFNEIKEEERNESTNETKYNIISPKTSNDVIGICISIILLSTLSFIFLRKKI